MLPQNIPPKTRISTVCWIFHCFCRCRGWAVTPWWRRQGGHPQFDYTLCYGQLRTMLRCGTKELPANLDVFKNHPSGSFRRGGSVGCQLGSFGRGGSVGRQLCIFLCFCAVQSLGRNFWPTDWTMVFFAVKSLDRNFDQRT